MQPIRQHIFFFALAPFILYKEKQQLVMQCYSRSGHRIPEMYPECNFIWTIYGLYIDPQNDQLPGWQRFRAVCSELVNQLSSDSLIEVGTICKGWFPYDRRRSQRELFPYNRRRSLTIAEPTVAIHFVQRKCQMYSRVLLAGKSKQTTWRTSRRNFRCKQIHFFF